MEGGGKPEVNKVFNIKSSQKISKHEKHVKKIGRQTKNKTQDNNKDEKQIKGKQSLIIKGAFKYEF